MISCYILHKFWPKINNFLNENVKSNPKGRKRNDDKKVILSLFRFLRVGCPWRDFTFPFPWNSVYSTFRRWTKSGLWSKLFYFVLTLIMTDPEWISVDSVTLPVHQQASRTANYQNEFIGRTAGGLTTKIHFMVDSLGNPLWFRISPGEEHDVKNAVEFLEHLPQDSLCFLGDKGYDSDEFRQGIRNKGLEPVIPGKSNRIEPIVYDKLIYKQRHVVENLFLRLQEFRRFAMRFEKKGIYFQSVVYLTAIAQGFIS